MVHQSPTGLDSYWVDSDTLKKIYENNKSFKKTRIQTENELQHDPLLHSHLWFPDVG